jgi:hypothetical protein
MGVSLDLSGYDAGKKVKGASAISSSIRWACC